MDKQSSKARQLVRRQVPAFLPLLEVALRRARICWGWDFGCCWLAPASILRWPAQQEPKMSRWPEFLLHVHLFLPQGIGSPSCGWQSLAQYWNAQVFSAAGDLTCSLCSRIFQSPRKEARVIAPDLYCLYHAQTNTIGPAAGRFCPLSQSLWIRNPSPLSCRSPSTAH